MKLEQIRIKNFRSIIDTKEIPIKQVTVLVGKNNQGKSNFVKAIEIAFQAITLYSFSPLSRLKRSAIYDYERDFPLLKKSDLENTEINMKLSLSEEESSKIFAITKVKILDYINVVVSIDRESRTEVKFSKKGASGLIDYAKEISQFILDSICFINIHAVRTENDSIGVINQLIENRMRFIDEDQEYADAMKIISNKEQEVLKEISGSTLKSLNTFLQDVKNVEIAVDDYRSRNRGFYYGRRFSMKIDDGILTDLQYKGDGIKSLAALALLKDNDSSSSTSIIAIEEPESHLHSGAIHSLNDILMNLSSTTQLLITTHNPLFVSRNSIDSNIIIRNNTAYVPKNIRELRDELGVMASDNLINSELVILVEGKTDSIILKSLIILHCNNLKKALENNRLIIKEVYGASKINQDIYYFKQMMCRVLVILDNDTAGREAIKIALEKNLLESNEYYVIRNETNVDCEIEDFINIDLYKNEIENKFGISLLHKNFKTSQKWSERIRKTFISQSKIFDDNIESECKNIVAECVENNPGLALNNYHLNIFNELTKKILHKLDK